MQESTETGRRMDWSPYFQPAFLSYLFLHPCINELRGPLLVCMFFFYYAGLGVKLWDIAYGTYLSVGIGMGNGNEWDEIGVFCTK